jgi:hypothetical protein
MGYLYRILLYPLAYLLNDHPRKAREALWALRRSVKFEPNSTLGAIKDFHAK